MEENKNNNVRFIFNIIDEWKSFYEIPVIYLTKQNYGGVFFNTYRDLNLAQSNNNCKENVMNIIVNFHLQWLQAINDVDNYKKQMQNMSFEEIFQAINYTIEANKQRLIDMKQYLCNLKLVGNFKQELDIELEILTNMNEKNAYELLEIQKCFSNFSDKREFLLKLNNAADDLLNWIDKLNDHVAIQCCNNFISTSILQELIKPLKDILLQINNITSEKYIAEINDNKEMKKMLYSPILINLQKSIISDIMDNVKKILQEIEIQNPIAASPFVNKKNYLETKLDNLNNSNLIKMAKINDLIINENCICYEVRIFNHSLSLVQRERLVTDLCSIWDKAFDAEKNRKSTISILSATSVKQKYTDELGEFYVDDYGRKVYEQGSKLFQQNNENKLVPLNDDENTIFFYDECGRYYIDKYTNERVYKANETASEYIMGPSGYLLKVKEVCDNVTFYYDSYGRYYVTDAGKHIYQDSDSNSEYEQDGFGNLVRIRSQSDLFDMCPDDSNITDDSKYLKETVGRALCQIITNIIIDQPNDPIKFLSASLISFRINQETKQKRLKERKELLLEREAKAAECIVDDALLQNLIDGVSECSSYDPNLLNYNTIDIGDGDSISTK